MGVDLSLYSHHAALGTVTMRESSNYAYVILQCSARCRQMKLIKIPKTGRQELTGKFTISSYEIIGLHKSRHASGRCLPPSETGLTFPTDIFHPLSVQMCAHFQRLWCKLVTLPNHSTPAKDYTWTEYFVFKDNQNGGC
jgi:hypothetical protein